MTTAAQREANRRNAKLSTGPRTAIGKVIASRNSLRHGLSVPVGFDAAIFEAAEALARAILGDVDDALLPYARAVAEAQLDINRVRQARHHILAKAHDGPEEAPQVVENKARIERFLRDQSPETLVNGDEVALLLMGLLHQAIKPQPNALERVALALPEKTKKLVSLERYERRALSRRKSAIRAFQGKKQQASHKGANVRLPK